MYDLLMYLRMLHTRVYACASETSASLRMAHPGGRSVRITRLDEILVPESRSKLLLLEICLFFSELVFVVIEKES